MKVHAHALPARARIACAAAALTLLGAGASAQQASAKTLRIGWTAIASNIAVKVADEKGFFKKYGIDVTITPNANSSNQLPSLGKQYDILVGTVTDVVHFAGKGGDPVVLNTGIVDTKATATQNLLVQKGVTSLKQLKGKTICVVAVGNGQQYVSAVIALAKAGVSKKDVRFINTPFPSMLDALRADRCQAALSVQPYINQIKAAGYGGLNNTLLSVAKQAPGSMYITNRSLVRKDKKSFQAFQKGYTEAVDYCKRNSEDCVDIIVRELGTNRNAARSTPWAQITPKTKNKWITDWIRPMERYGFIKKGRVSPKKSYVVK